MIEEFSHLSILAGAQVGFLLHFSEQAMAAHGKTVTQLLERAGAFQLGDAPTSFFLMTTLKELHQLLIQWATVDRETAQILASQAHKVYPSAIRSVEFYLRTG